ncbi:sialin-like [Anticarsia gemmatalis]|uniref:sialin-like n=1 Tax=Anticarsia gemmatalis TaxID=129554 RepID=UPI003F7687FB
MDVPVKEAAFLRYFPTRYIVAVLGSMGMLIVYGLSGNMSLSGASAKVMFNHTAIRIASGGIDKAAPSILYNDFTCPDTPKIINVNVADGPLAFTTEHNARFLQQGFYYGYQGFILMGAQKAELRSAKWVMLIGVVTCIVSTLLTPAFASAGAFGLGCIRIGLGAGTALSYPAMHVLVARWAPPTERGVMEAIVSTSKSLGPALYGAMATTISASLGWTAVFYISGALSIVWCGFWVMMVDDSPQRQRLITLDERNLIVSSLGDVIGDQTRDKLPAPWCAILRSRAFLVLCFCHSCSNIGVISLLVVLPLYMASVMKYNVTEDNTVLILSALFQGVFAIGLSMVLNVLSTRHYISIVQIRKISTAFASAVPALCLCGVLVLRCNVTGATVLWSIAVVATGGTHSGILANHIDIAPNYAGNLTGYTDFIAGLFIGLMAILAGIWMFTAGPSWKIVFIIMILIYVIELVVFSLFATSEEQPWNRPAHKDDEEDAPPDNIEMTQPTVSTQADITSEGTRPSEVQPENLNNVHSIEPPVTEQRKA